MTDATSYVALKREVAAFDLDRDVVAVRGADAESFLQGQISQDVVALAEGASAWSFILQPQGKVDAWFRVSRIAPDEFILDVDKGFGAALTARIERFKLRVDVAVTELDWRCIAVRGPGTPAGLSAAVVAPVDWGPMVGVDLLGPDVALPDGMVVAEPEAYEALRIEAGFPAMGRELTENTIPAEAGIVDVSASFTKGCYTGQELVARVDSRGNNTPRNLRGVVISSNVLPPVGAEIVLDGKVVGSLTSTAESLDLRAPVALGYVGRAVEAPAAVTLRWDGGQTDAEVRELPLG